jgi:septal ring factor EnvC (AmiA/AmiB activator)
MRRRAPLLLIAPLLLAASAPLPPPAEPLDAELQRARTEQASAEAEANRLDRIADSARGEAAKLQAREAAAAEALQAAEARITTADTQLRLISAAVETRRARLQSEQRPVASLLAGLAMMARRPPLFALTEQGGTDELVKVRILLDATLPVIRRRTSALSAQLAEGERLQHSALAARRELADSRATLAQKRQAFAALESQALKAATAAGGQALGAGDVALAQGEDVERLRGAEAGSRAAWALASQLAAADPAPARPLPPEGRGPPPPFAYELPAAAPVTDGLGSVNASGIRSRGLTFGTGRGAAVTVPASGVIRFSGPFRNHDGVVIIDHGGGWMSLIVNVASPHKAGDRVRIGEPLGRALGPLAVELSQNGRRTSPALIAGSSEGLSNGAKGG